VADLWRIRAACYSTRGATVPAGTVHVEKVERGAARVAGSRGNAGRGTSLTADKREGFSF
jgi:threonine dehydratase